jgi:hypothetical protein
MDYAAANCATVLSAFIVGREMPTCKITRQAIGGQQVE